MGLLNNDGELLLSYQFLIDNGISPNTIKKWIARKSADRILLDNIFFIKYQSIPEQSKNKLPEKSKLQSLLYDQLEGLKQSHYNNILKKAYQTTFLKYRDEYKTDKRLNAEQIIYCSQLHAVWVAVLECCNRGRGVTEMLHKAFNTIYIDKYPTYASFCVTKTKAKKDLKSVTIDERWFRVQDNKLDDQIFFWAKGLLSDPVNHTGRSILRKLTVLCKEASLNPPSYSWIKKFVKDNETNQEIFASKYGASAAFNSIEPHAKIQTAKNAGSQWQIDGWDLPFYYKGIVNGKTTGYLKLVLFVVRDAYSKKIVGYSVGESESTTLILSGIEDAVKNTRFLPFEIVSDNHSFNKTSEAVYFKEALKNIGTKWNVDHNPRRKAIAERAFRELGEQHCKDYPGYIGQSIKTKEKSGRPAQEYIDHFTKTENWQTKEEIIAIAAKVVSDYNNAVLTKKGLTPNQLHEQSEKPFIFNLTFDDRLRLFTQKTKLTVRRGQLNLTRGGVTYEYQLNASDMERLNGKEVFVRFVDYDMIYLFDHKDRPLLNELGEGISVSQKVAIHGALADQTERDIELLNKNKGRLKGFKTKAKKRNEAERNKIEAISPNAVEALNRITTPKDILKELESDYNLRQRVEELGVNTSMIEVRRKSESLIPQSLQPQTKNIKSPFSVRSNHKATLIDLKEDREEF